MTEKQLHCYKLYYVIISIIFCLNFLSFIEEAGPPVLLFLLYFYPHFSATHINHPCKNKIV